MPKSIAEKIKRFLRGGFAAGELLWCGLFLRRRADGEASGRVVVIQDCHVGDFLVALPFFQRLARFYGCKLTLISDRRIGPLAEACGVFGETVLIDMKRASSYRHLLYRWRTLGRLRKLTTRVLVRKYAVGATSLEDCFAVVIPAREKIAVESERTAAGAGGGLYRRLLRKNFDRLYRYDSGANLLENENAFCNWICGTRESDCVGGLECFEPLPERDAELGEYVLLIPGADDPRRRWEAEKFAWIAQRLHEVRPRWRILLSGAPSERETVARVLAALPEETARHVKVREGQADVLSSLKRLFSDVKHARLVLVGETGPLHMAAKYGTRCCCLSGGWHRGVWAPWPEYAHTVYFQERCRYGHEGCFGQCRDKGAPFRCLRDLTAEQVWERIESDLSEKREAQK